MVVSGLPQTNGEKHVNEIASLALDMLRTCRSLKMPKIQEEQLHMRIGINTGMQQLFSMLPIQ